MLPHFIHTWNWQLVSLVGNLLVVDLIKMYFTLLGRLTTIIRVIIKKNYQNNYIKIVINCSKSEYCKKKFIFVVCDNVCDNKYVY